MATLGTIDTSRLWGILGVAEERKTSPSPHQHQGGGWGWGKAPCVAWERQGTAGSPGILGQILLHRYQDGDISRGDHPALHPRSLQAAALLVLCLVWSHELHSEVILARVRLNQMTQGGKNYIYIYTRMRILPTKQEILWMLSGSAGQHLARESCGLVKVGLPLGSLSALGGMAENKLQET